MVAGRDLCRVDLKLGGVEGYRGRVLDDIQAGEGSAGKLFPNARNCILNGHGALVGELLKVGLEGQVIVERLDIGRQHLAAFGDVDGGVALCAKVLAHGSSVRAVSRRD